MEKEIKITIQTKDFKKDIILTEETLKTQMNPEYKLLQAIEAVWKSQYGENLGL